MVEMPKSGVGFEDGIYGGSSIDAGDRLVVPVQLLARIRIPILR